MLIIIKLRKNEFITRNEKEYEVLVDKNLSGMAEKLMSKGVDIEGYKTKPAVVKKNAKNAKRFTITLTEGKKHQIRRMCAALGYQVQTLKRVRIINVKLGKLKPNQYRKIVGEELQQLLLNTPMNVNNSTLESQTLVPLK